MLCLNSLVFIVTFFLLISNLCCILLAIWESMVSQEIPFIFIFLVKTTVGIWECVSLTSLLGNFSVRFNMVLKIMKLILYNRVLGNTVSSQRAH